MWIFREIRKCLGNIFLLLLLLSAFSLIFTSIINGKATIFGIRPMVVTTNSMAPTLTVGSIIVGISVEPEEIQVGDIIAYRAGKKGDWFRPVIVHRIVAVTGDGFIFQGDNNHESDNAIVTGEQILFRFLNVK